MAVVDKRQTSKSFIIMKKTVVLLIWSIPQAPLHSNDHGLSTESSAQVLTSTMSQHATIETLEQGHTHEAATTMPAHTLESTSTFDSELPGAAEVHHLSCLKHTLLAYQTAYIFLIAITILQANLVDTSSNDQTAMHADVQALTKDELKEWIGTNGMVTSDWRFHTKDGEQ